MAKFHIRLKLEGLEVEVDGERQDIPLITSALEQQMTSLIRPAETLTDGRKQLTAESSQAADAEVAKPRSRSSRRAKGSGENASTQPIEFEHDASQFGNPVQGWSVTDKSIWLLYVLKKLKDCREVGGPCLAATFNQHFKSAGKLHPPNVTRELGRLKSAVPPLVGEDRDLWFLTDEGTRKAQQLVHDALSAPTPA
jgi:hypothetical protein